MNHPPAACPAPSTYSRFLQLFGSNYLLYRQCLLTGAKGVSGSGGGGRHCRSGASVQGEGPKGGGGASLQFRFSSVRAGRPVRPGRVTSVNSLCFWAVRRLGLTVAQVGVAQRAHVHARTLSMAAAAGRPCRRRGRRQTGSAAPGTWHGCRSLRPPGPAAAQHRKQDGHACRVTRSQVMLQDNILFAVCQRVSSSPWRRHSQRNTPPEPAGIALRTRPAAPAASAAPPGWGSSCRWFAPAGWQVRRQRGRGAAGEARSQAATPRGAVRSCMQSSASSAAHQVTVPMRHRAASRTVHAAWRRLQRGHELLAGTRPHANPSLLHSFVVHRAQHPP